MSINTISICSQIKNRLYQFKQTFNHNLIEINKYNNVDWIIVDIQSDDGLDSFLKDFLSKYNKNNIHYYKILDDIPYSIPIAKNFSTRLSNSDFLFNLDIDNYIDNIIDNILFLKNNTGIKCNTIRKGVYGRIGCHSEYMKTIGGYDESFLPAAGHENDLINRLTNIGYDLQHIECQKLPIQNSKEETIKNFAKNNYTWEAMNKINSDKAQNNLANKIIYPNIKFTEAGFVHNFKNKIQLSNSYQ